MQFVSNGPDIPERLLQAHEEGNVVFFCRAGISYPARLPSFKHLATQLYRQFGITPSAVQQAAIKAGQFDTAIGLLEANIRGGREIVRRALENILTPNLMAPNAIDTHEALLTLGRNRNGLIRLITTNFDRLFEIVINKESLDIKRFLAPLLPVPKNRWDGLVYLHGLLTSEPTASDLDQLVVSSGDFGLAYLTERWAARFVSELFRGYTVCFVGYSINDPVLRYMMDALAADRLRGESPPEMFAFGSYSKGKKEERANEWRAKNVTPILYREHNHHAFLHKTLRIWAQTYRDGALGKERVVVDYAMARPIGNTWEDDFVGRMLWALSDPSGLPAKRFANFDPAPSLDWLDVLGEDRYRHADLSRFGVLAGVAQKDLTFSLLRRPAPYERAPWMVLADAGGTDSQWDYVMFHLAHWLTRHLDDPRLILWLARQGGHPHKQLVWQIEGRLKELDQYEGEGKHDEIERIRNGAPNAIPRPAMRTLWSLVLADRLKSVRRDLDLYGWKTRFAREGITPLLRLALRELLSPRIVLAEPFHLSEQNEEPEPLQIKSLVEWEIVLSADNVHAALRDLMPSPRWVEALPELLDDVNMLLRDALELMGELGGANDKNDLSYIHQPSISAHPQNRDFHDWTVLIDLARDAWLATLPHFPGRALSVAEDWWRAPYPLFKRMAMFAGARGDAIPVHTALNWLFSDEHWWLWSVEVQREALQLLVALFPKLNREELAELEQAVLAGPPSVILDGFETERRTQIMEHEIWLRLAKMNATGVALGTAATARLDELAVKYPQWQLAADERDEFPFWMSTSLTGAGSGWRQFTATPRRRRELADWLRQHRNRSLGEEDDWRDRCVKNFATAACALYMLTREGEWPEEPWMEALQVWSTEPLTNRSWRYMAPVLCAAPDAFLLSLAHGVSWWLHSVAKIFEGHEVLFLNLCHRILELGHQDSVGGGEGEVVTRAINHPVGLVTEALLRWWYRRSPEDGQGLPEDLKPIFSALCDTEINKFRHGRVLLAAHVIALFRVDSDWATLHLLPLFNWQHAANDTCAVWEGFLWSPQLYRPLIAALRRPFLETAEHYAALGEHGRQYATLLTLAGLDRGDTFSVAELRDATRAMPIEGLHDAAQTLVQTLESAGDQRADYWKNRVLPYLRSIWPNSRDSVSLAVSESLAHLCIAAQQAFPEALSTLQPWLQPIQYPDYVVRRLDERKLCAQFPDAALRFLNIIIGTQTLWPPTNLKDCLDDIRDAMPHIIDDSHFRWLSDYLRIHDPT